MSDITTQHQNEVKSGDRFEFGKNWANFLSTLTDQKVDLAMKSLQSYLKVDSLDGKTFIDIGSGSGLFSLAARKLGAKVRSFDYDPNSYKCTAELRRRYFPDDANWVVQQGSVLDKAFMASLGTYDIVYSWGVLHHTGSMWEALDNVKPLCPIGGQLFIAIYNDHGPITDLWWKIKKRYNSLPKPLDFLYMLTVIGNRESRELNVYIKHGQLREYIRGWREYATISVRGMNKWYDWVDWIGGYPYERATISEIVDYYAPDGFRLDMLSDSSAGYGCNQFVFRRVAGAGTFVDSRIPGGTLMTRRFGARIPGPFTLTPDGWVGTAPNLPDAPASSKLYLIRDDVQLIGEAKVGPDHRVIVAAADAPADMVEKSMFHLVAAHEEPANQPFNHERGFMWNLPVLKLAHVSDTMAEPRRSPVYVFEDDVQLSAPHAIHDTIADVGKGRFCHWSSFVYFSTSDNTDPNTNGRRYRFLMAAQPLLPELALSNLHGVKVEGPFLLTDAGWTANAPAGSDLWLLANDELVGPVQPDGGGRIVVAPASAAEHSVAEMKLYVVSAKVTRVSGPFVSGGGLLWTAPLGNIGTPGDNSERPNQSTGFVFQGPTQLPLPRSSHADIVEIGEGRFSHWHDSLYLSTLTGEDPNQLEIRILVPLTNG